MPITGTCSRICKPTAATEPAEEAAFDAVLATFVQHAEHWIGEVEGWAKAEQG